jgi:hypothetical protein
MPGGGTDAKPLRVRDETVDPERLGGLTPAARQWGKMDPAQMMAHCSVAMEAGTGDKPLKQALIGKIFAPFVRSSFLSDKPFGKNSPTDPTFVVSDARDFAREKERLTALVARFCERGPAEAGRHTHSFLGKITGDDWGVVMYKHLITTSGNRRLKRILSPEKAPVPPVSRPPVPSSPSPPSPPVPSPPVSLLVRVGGRFGDFVADGADEGFDRGVFEALGTEGALGELDPASVGVDLESQHPRLAGPVNPHRHVLGLVDGGPVFGRVGRLLLLHEGVTLLLQSRADAVKSGFQGQYFGPLLV